MGRSLPWATGVWAPVVLAGHSVLAALSGLPLVSSLNRLIALLKFARHRAGAFKV